MIGQQSPALCGGNPANDLHEQGDIERGRHEIYRPPAEHIGNKPAEKARQEDAGRDAGGNNPDHFSARMLWRKISHQGDDYLSCDSGESHESKKQGKRMEGR